jgi:hypothetical protein
VPGKALETLTPGPLVPPLVMLPLRPLPPLGPVGRGPLAGAGGAVQPDTPGAAAVLTFASDTGAWE